MNVTVTIDKIEKPRFGNGGELIVRATLSYGAINKPSKLINGMRRYTEHGDCSIFKYTQSQRQIKAKGLLELINEAIDKAVA